MERFTLLAAVSAYMMLALGLPSLMAFFVHGVWPLAFHRDADRFQRAMGLLFGALLLGVVVWALMVGLVGPEALGVWTAPPALATLGWALAAVATLLTLLAQFQMGASWRIGIDDQPTQLVTRGAFAISRNPIFTGMLATLAAIVLITPALWTIAGWVATAAVIAAQVRLEEQKLLAVHGDAYAEYAAGTGRFLPWIGRLHGSVRVTDAGPATSSSDRPMPGFAFRGMALIFRVRDLLVAPSSLLDEAPLDTGMRVVDYGCGSGSHTLAAARLVGNDGEVVALDIHPLAVQSVTEAAKKRGLTNVRATRTDCATGQPDDSVDLVLLYDIFHMLGQPGDVLAELHRVLRPDGRLSFSDHHMKRSAILDGVTGAGLFRLVGEGDKSLTFEPVK